VTLFAKFIVFALAKITAREN